MVDVFGHPACAAHDTGRGHPETARRLDVVEAALRGDAALAARLRFRTATPAADEDLLRVHAPSHLRRIRDACAAAAAAGGLAWLDDDTPVSARSWEAALAASGCAIAAVDAALSGEVPAAFALARPPGHHAARERASGFCLVNHVAIAIRRAQARGALRRALVVDVDAHHGDGTQEIFEEDPSVYVLSVHLAGEYPWTGRADERGRGAGAGTTRNVPLAAGTGAAEYLRVLDEALGAALAAFQPDVAVLSAGFDALEGDPEGGLALAAADYHAIAAALRLALPAPAPIAAVLEGGYRLPDAGDAAAQLLRGLAGLPAR